MHILGFLLFGLLLLQRGFSCVISGTDSGTCSKRYLPSTYGNDVSAIDTARSLWDCEGRDCLPFCGKFVASYEICLPKSDGVPLPPDQNFPNGRFHHTTSTYYKDSWVKKTALETIANKQGLDCQEAYKRYLCYANFPRCDENEYRFPCARAFAPISCVPAEWTRNCVRSARLALSRQRSQVAIMKKNCLLLLPPSPASHLFRTNGEAEAEVNLTLSAHPQ